MEPNKRGPSKFRQSEVARAVRGAKAGGFDATQVRIGPDGTIVLDGKPTTDEPDGNKAPEEIVL